MSESLLLHPRPRAVRATGQFRARPPRPGCFASAAASPRLAAAIAALGFESAPDGAPIKLSLVAGSQPKDGYKLRIKLARIDIESATEAGLVHGLATLRQIFLQSPHALPCLEIEDWPDLPVRGYMLDVSRCKVPTLPSLFALVDLLASLKYNQLQLYMEHTFAYSGHERVWRDASPLDAAEIRALDAYCHDRYIELVPNQNSFGHMERWLRHEPYKRLAECPNGFEHPFSGWKTHGSTLKPDDESLDFVDTLHAELLPNFRSRNFNIGGDEPWELGQGWSEPRVKERGKRRVYLDFLLKLHKRVSARGRRMQFWGDIVLEEPELARELPRDLTALLWGYEASHPFPKQCAAFRDARVPFYVVPGTSSWNAIGGRPANALANIREACRNAIGCGAEGALLTDWGDGGHHQPPCVSLLPIIAAAGLSWSFEQSLGADLESVANSLIPEPLSSEQLSTLRALGACPSEFAAPLHNASWLNKILFAPQATLPKVLASVTESELRACLDLLQPLPLGDATLVDSELSVAARLLRFACAKGLAGLGEASPPELPADLVDRFRQNWLARNRPGGLDESADNLVRPNA